jgi:hypothetical protein
LVHDHHPHAGAGQVETACRTIVDEAHELVRRTFDDHGAKQLARKPAVSASVRPARCVDADAHQRSRPASSMFARATQAVNMARMSAHLRQ